MTKNKYIWSKNHSGASTSVFRHFKAHCFEWLCKSQFGCSFLFRFFAKETHNTGEESKRAKRTKQRTKKYKEHRMHQRRRNTIGNTQKWVTRWSWWGWWNAPESKFCSAAEMIIRWRFQKVQKRWRLHPEPQRMGSFNHKVRVNLLLWQLSFWTKAPDQHVMLPGSAAGTLKDQNTHLKLALSYHASSWSSIPWRCETQNEPERICAKKMWYTSRFVRVIFAQGPRAGWPLTCLL